MAQSLAILRLFVDFLIPSRKMPKKFLKLVHDRPFPHLFPNLTARMYLSVPLHFLLILHFTSPSVFPYLSFIVYVVCYIFKSHKNILTDGRTLDSGSHSHPKTMPWTTNCPEEGCPARDPWPHVSNMLRTHYKNDKTIKAVSYTIYCDFCKCFPRTGPQ